MDWLTISKDSGSGNDIISITASTNTELVDRVAKIKFINDTYGITANTIVRQYKRSVTNITIDPTDVAVFSTGGLIKLKIETNSTSWRIASLPDWATADIMSGGSGISVVSITFEEHTGDTERYGTIRVLNEDNVEAVCNVTQYRFEPTFRFEPHFIQIDSEATEFNAEILCNVGGWSIIECSEWLHVDTMSGYSNYTFTITADANAGTVYRDGTIIIQNSDGSKSDTLYVRQNAFVPEADITIDPTEFNFDPAGEVLYLHLTATADWTWTEFADWVGITPAYVTGGTAGTHTIALTALKNTTGSRLSGRFAIKCGNKIVSFNVYQNHFEPEPTKTISVTPTSISAPEEGGIYQVNVTSNGTWEIQAPTWVGLSATGGTGNAIIDVLLSENEEYTQLNGTVLFKTKDNTASLSITQDAKKYIPVTIEVSPTDLDFDSTGGTYTIHITSNGEWNITAPDWLQLSNTSGEGDMDVTVTAPENVTYDYLLGDIVITTRDNTAEVSVVQDGAEKPEPLIFYANGEGNINCSTGRTGSTLPYPKVEYSTNGTDWYLFKDRDSVKFTDYIYVRGSLDSYSNIRFGGNFTSVSGNIMSLCKKYTLSNSMFYELFYDCKNLVDASGLILPKTTLAKDCYRDMFLNCTSLVNAPSILPATTLAEGCYREMFGSCDSLVNTPELPATTLAKNCYQDMFAFCSSLENAPELPATTLAEGCCREMFTYCENLVNVPSILPAIELAVDCYYEMFNGCYNLVNAPELPATTLATNCYCGMFGGCKSLVNAPALPAETLAQSCYDSMFKGCKSLVNAPALPATTLAQSCYLSMFDSCTALVNAPALPATTLVPYCYTQMFDYCTSLEEAPELPAPTLVEKCYKFMFRGCSSLNKIKCLAIDLGKGKEETNNWMYRVAGSGIFLKPVGVNWGRGTVDGIPNNWVVIDIPSLNVDTETIDIGVEGGIVNVKITASSEWNVTSHPSFVNMELSGDEGVTTLPIEVLEYTGQGDREGNIVITCGDITKTISVHQKSIKFVSAVYSTLSPSTSTTALFNFTKPEDLGLIRFVGERRTDYDSNFVIGGANYKSYNYDIIKYSSKKFQVGNQTSNLTKLTGEPFDITVKAGENNTTIFTDSISGYEQILQPTGSFGLDPAFDFDKSSKYQADAHRQKLSIVQFAKADGTLLIDAHAAVDANGTIGLYDKISGVMYTTITELTYDE